LEPEESKILELKYRSTTFAKMLPEKLLHEATVLLLKIHVITGWEIPQKELMNILIDQFTKKILESYSNLNVDEIEFIFRNKPIEIKEWGKAMNISLMDEVIIPYMEKRFELSKVEEQKKQVDYKISEEEKEKIDREYQEFLKTELGQRLNPKI